MSHRKINEEQKYNKRGMKWELKNIGVKLNF